MVQELHCVERALVAVIFTGEKDELDEFLVELEFFATDVGSGEVSVVQVVACVV
jgi:hypothetical protein